MVVEEEWEVIGGPGFWLSVDGTIKVTIDGSE
jgi:hypothetical protein